MSINRLKGISSRRLRRQCPTQLRKYLWGKHFRSPSHFAASCGGEPLTTIERDIEQQNRPDRPASDRPRQLHKTGSASPRA
jgi:putative transposase